MSSDRHTLSQRLDATRQRPSGFDYMRILLALGVICWHTVITSYGGNAQTRLENSFWWEPFGLILPMFFALSGFLVAGSLERCKTLFMFLGLRTIRILPALAVETAISALLIGPLFTAGSEKAYFSAPDFHRYFLNILGDIHYHLPGVFTSNPNDAVNGQLWTVPYELTCYIVIAGLALAGAVKDRRKLLAALAIFYLFEIANTFIHPRHFNGLASGWSLVMMFLAGITLYRYRGTVLWNRKFLLVSLVFGLALIAIPNGDRFEALPLAYLTVYLGLLNPPRLRWLLSGDYSYGLFLYGFPIQQACVALGFARGNWYLNLAAAIPVGFAVAVTSWWLIEKPALKSRTLLKRIEAEYLARFVKAPEPPAPAVEAKEAA